MIYQLAEHQPIIDESCFIAPTAAVIGQVMLHKNASVWFNVVMRADCDTITVGENTNIQDGSILHVDEKFPLTLGTNVTIGHKVMLHGCTIGDNSLVGMNAVVLNGAKIGKHCLIGANALVTEGMEIPDGHMVLGSPAKVIKPLDEKTQALLKHSADHYVNNAQFFAEQLTEIK
ncbi:gamma carbonic anhydrase family protein [Thalassotalea sp. LPB0316]|uniref:gamma carbonic anhydrase family protein n=1 Tax=Thalassotalea sp. LPB0316 TaxID=2769490 RepID=UPI001869558B|nr:gamma carbonic anhydrase family protein [Thalassotalea sp. LPB0316]QOL24691.1 gamma carbonic anhydrase family protein [Thalassotalea sp. LPB0316]